MAAGIQGRLLSSLIVYSSKTAAGNACCRVADSDMEQRIAVGSWIAAGKLNRWLFSDLLWLPLRFEVWFLVKISFLFFEIRVCFFDLCVCVLTSGSGLAAERIHILISDGYWSGDGCTSNPADCRSGSLYSSCCKPVIAQVESDWIWMVCLHVLALDDGWIGAAAWTSCAVGSSLAGFWLGRMLFQEVFQRWKNLLLLGLPAFWFAYGSFGSFWQAVWFRTHLSESGRTCQRWFIVFSSESFCPGFSDPELFREFWLEMIWYRIGFR